MYLIFGQQIVRHFADEIVCKHIFVQFHYLVLDRAFVEAYTYHLCFDWGPSTFVHKLHGGRLQQQTPLFYFPLSLLAKERLPSFPVETIKFSFCIPILQSVCWLNKYYIGVDCVWLCSSLFQPMTIVCDYALYSSLEQGTSYNNFLHLSKSSFFNR